MNSLYPTFHEKNLDAFNMLLMEAEEFDTNPEESDKKAEKKDPATMTEDEVFSKVKQDNEIDNDTRAYSFLGRSVDGSLGAINDVTNERDPAIKGLTNVIVGSIMRDSENTIDYVTTLFNITGVNDMSEEDFEKIKGTIWTKLEDLTADEPVQAFSTFKKFIEGLVTGIRKNSELDGPA